ncbi:type II toxin-antitoxin system HigB family toxin [Tautonia plasticadhaerens]|uniref:mRNA interferase HigB n=1 Tax=Tautonia plasticadhaerens TaxID=2527974 RepID=A0A518HFN7_9BACT|nr:type II toxin-antitoxin system HigB family toxin [Tautonia plasticadhaerens]QDV39660.1 hypothetical protein ElP_76320 [Tautonia plasticadhaerens]
MSSSLGSASDLRDLVGSVEESYGCHKIASRSTWQGFAEVRATCSKSADQVGRCGVFNIGGNKYRLITRILFQWGRLYVLHVLTHEQYDRGAWKADCC